MNFKLCSKSLYFLGLFCFFLIAAPLFSGGAEQIKIEDIKAIFPEGASIEKASGSIWFLVFNKDRKLVGKAALTSPYCDDIKGYGGAIPLLVGVDTKDEIRGIIILPNKETPGIVDVINKSGFLDSFIGFKLEDLDKKHIDSVTGATITSEAIIKILKVFYKKAK